jgi:F-type H+-transporting ATPase subunit b
MNNRLARLLRTLAPIAAGAVLLVLADTSLARQGEHTTPAAAHEGGGEPKAGVLPTVEQGIAPSVISLVVFGLVLAVVATKVWPQIAKGLDERATKIRDEIAAAEAARKQAKEALEQYERSLAEARAEAQRMLEKTKAQQQELANELKAKADQELNAMKDRARRDIESAKRAAISEIYNEAANLATSVAGKILQREVTPRPAAAGGGVAGGAAVVASLRAEELNHRAHRAGALAPGGRARRPADEHGPARTFSSFRALRVSVVKDQRTCH